MRPPQVPPKLTYGYLGLREADEGVTLGVVGREESRRGIHECQAFSTLGF